MPEVNPLRRLRTRQAIDDPAAVLDDPHAALLAAAGLGDEDAFARLYDELAPLLHGIVLRVLRDPARSEEVTQEVFVELWRLAPRYDGTRGTVRSGRRPSRTDERSTGSGPSSRPATATSATWTCAPTRSPRSTRSSATGSSANVSHGRWASSPICNGRPSSWPTTEGTRTGKSPCMLGVAEGTVKTRIRDGLIRLRDEMGVTT